MEVRSWIKDHSPNPVLKVFRLLYYGPFKYMMFMADSFGLINPNHIYQEQNYTKRQNDPWRSDAHIVAHAIQQHFDPDSVIDFGCAIGSHLELFYEDGCQVKGVEGNEEALKHSVIPSMFIDPADLREPYETDIDYDVVLCFEVAEHIPERYADTLVETLSSAGEVIVMTAATPGQSGTHHVNLQKRDYWFTKFREHGMSYNERAVADLKQSMKVDKATWIPENLMVFVQNDKY